MVLFVWLPESPHHLVKVNEFDKAKKSIDWYRAGQSVDEEFEAVMKFVKSSNSQSFSEKAKELGEPAIFRATLLIILLYTFMQLSGFNNVLFYMETILIQAEANVIQPKDVVVYANFAAFVVSALSIAMIDKYGRKALLVTSSVGVTVSLAGLGVHFYLAERDFNVNEQMLQWLPIASMFLFNVSFFFGFFCVPSAVLSELFPSNVKCTVSCFASLAAAIFAFVSTKSYQPLIDSIGQSNVFFLHAFVTALIVPYLIIYMPETKGKTLQEIQDIIMKK